MNFIYQVGIRSVKEPWRIALSLIYKVFKDQFNEFIPKHLKDKEYNIIRTMIDRKINSPKTSSMGRLFDGVYATLGFTSAITFEGEAAISLENICTEKNNESYEFEIQENEGKFILGFNNIIKGIICDIDNKVNNSIIARKFHNTIIKSTIEMALYIREKTNINTVVISGGVFQNEILFKGVVKGLEQYKFNIVTHKIIPCNDSGVSLGQLIIANELVKEELRGESYVYSNSSKD